MNARAHQGEALANAMDAHSDSLRKSVEILKSVMAELERARNCASEVGAEISVSLQELRLLAERVSAKESVRIGTDRVTEMHESILHRLDAIRAKAVQASAREIQMNQALAETGRRIADLTRSIADAEAAHAAIENSHSWRMTKSLRVARRAFRACVARLASALRSMLRVPARVTRRTLRAGVGHLRAHPRRKEVAKRMLARSGRFGAYVRNLAREPSSFVFDVPQRHEPSTTQQSRAVNDVREIPVAPRAATTAERLAIARRMAYVAELETRLDEQGARHRQELERLLQEVGRLRVSEPRP